MIKYLKNVSRVALNSRFAFFCGLVLTSALHFANAHEVETNKLNLVQREPLHISATFYVNPGDYFQPVLNDQVTQQTVYVHLASMDDESFETLNSKVQAFYKKQIKFKLLNDASVQLSNWQFANGLSIRKSIQQHLAQQLLVPGSHAHFEPVQFTVQLTGRTDLSKILPKLPSNFGKVLVIANKPQQIWLDSSLGATWIKF